MSLLKKFAKVLIVIALAYAVGRFVVVFKDSRLTGYRAPYIQMLTPDSVIIRWATEDNQLGIVRFGEDHEHMSTVEIEQSPSKNHAVKLSNLEPATRYYYQTGTINDFYEFDTEKQWFYTHPEEVLPTRVWVIGDSGEAGETSNQVRDSALSWMRQNPLVLNQDAFHRAPDDKLLQAPLINIWIALGDIAYRSGTNEQFQSALFEPFGDLLANTAIWPVYGNHDERRWTYFRIFDLPENAEAGGLASHTENYYSVDYSNIHFVMLDSQASDRSKTGDMANWLKRDLAQNKKPWVIAAFHHPPYTKGSHDSDDASDSRGRMQQMRENIVPILEESGVDLVLSGHSHMYERSYLMDCAYGDSEKFSLSNIVSTGVNNKYRQYLKPLNRREHQGTVYVVAGSSSKVDQGPLDHPAHHVGLLEAGSMVIDVENNKLTARFINNKGQVRDEFSITKEAGYESGYSGCDKQLSE
ncbi:MAG: hypothetical protein BMS9Abin19_0814 [Gammaproteobacteria bacterium]|nr:MAG: hypothetical protein BMS9Abin19_0814 [Gammaproteobacteria bacterium]